MEPPFIEPPAGALLDIVDGEPLDIVDGAPEAVGAGDDIVVWACAASAVAARAAASANGVIVFPNKYDPPRKIA